MLQPQNITDYYINTHLKSGSVAIDATAGNGNDTLKLCKAVGENGKVFAFDIQKQALDTTAARLCEEGFENAELILDSHSEMDKYITSECDAVIFNLGYLPGGDHLLQTKAETTIDAIEKSLALLSEHGFISVTVYYGKNSGTAEKEAVMEYMRTIDHKKYTVLTCDFHNRPNNPPITVIITKN
ncbi:MAG: class I SAM-dependent methyltransferase [Clostridia bacterium]|nr:class I SAM-dependent methyltransferase [Clostridia bacterium]